MKIGILTSSRADFGIYLPLVKELFKDDFFAPEIIAFGTHLSEKFGMTMNEIKNEGFEVKHKLETIPENDSPYAIAKSIATTADVFAGFWNENSFDLVFALGDRFEMLAAVLAGSPFNVNYAHIHAGETTLGAIDNAYRHSISLMSKYLFVSTEEYRNRAVEIIQRPEDVFNVGALSIDNLKQETLYSQKEFYYKFGIDLLQPTILCTFHPETIGFEKNEQYVQELLAALQVLSEDYRIVITMPNTDTTGLMIRKYIIDFANKNDKVSLVESFGMRGYLSCMKYSTMLIGNTSSAFVEASFFPKWVINLGTRQKGRVLTPNIHTIPIKKEAILQTVRKIEGTLELQEGCNFYGNGDAAERIFTILKNLS